MLPWSDFIAGACAANRALDVLASASPCDIVLPQTACMRALVPELEFAWPVLCTNELPQEEELALGEHNDTVYGSLGLEEEAVNRLYIQGII